MQQAATSQPSFVHAYIEKRRAHWNAVVSRSKGKSFFARAYRRLLGRTYGFLIPEGSRILEIGCADGQLLAGLKPARGVGVDFCEIQVEKAKARHGDHPISSSRVCEALDVKVDEPFDYVVASDLIDDLWDVQRFFQILADQVSPRTRIIVNSYSKLWELPLAVARRLGLATPLLRQNWLSPHDVSTIAELRRAGNDVIRSFPDVLLPTTVPGISGFSIGFSHVCGLSASSP